VTGNICMCPIVRDKKTAPGLPPAPLDRLVTGYR
jgi:hypothetical protein